MGLEDHRHEGFHKKFQKRCLYIGGGCPSLCILMLALVSIQSYSPFLFCIPCLSHCNLVKLVCEDIDNMQFIHVII